MLRPPWATPERLRALRVPIKGIWHSVLYVIGSPAVARDRRLGYTTCGLTFAHEGGGPALPAEPITTSDVSPRCERCFP